MPLRQNVAQSASKSSQRVAQSHAINALLCTILSASKTMSGVAAKSAPARLPAKLHQSFLFLSWLRFVYIYNPEQLVALAWQ